MNVKEVDAIPYDIDGDHVLRLKLKSVNHLALALRDGRKWKRYTSYTKPKSATRRTYRRACKGGMVCRNDGCEFLRKYKFRNHSQFENRGDNVTCRECLQSVFKFPCLATKYVTFDDEDELHVDVRYEGDHSCTAIKPAEVSEFELSEISKIMPNVTAAEAAKIILREGVTSLPSSSDALCLAASFLDKRAVRDKTNSIRKSLRPDGTSVEAVRTFQQSLQSKWYGDYRVYKVVDAPLSVLTTSDERIAIAVTMTHGLEPWTQVEPYAHLDFQPSRGRGLTCLGVNCYHPLLKETVWLFK